jgi:enamine deaminase RidA (YjgF/YER057c/UK114 family)
VSTPHAVVNPPTLAPAVGFAHAVVAAPGRTVWLGGQTGVDVTGRVVGGSLVEQFDRAAANVVAALAAAGAGPEHLVSMLICTTDMSAYRSALPELGAAYRRRLGRHYPATALVGVTQLFDGEALVELICVAVVPE